MEMFYTVKISLYILYCCLPVISADCSIKAVTALSLVEDLILACVKIMILVGHYDLSALDIVLNQKAK